MKTYHHSLRPRRARHASDQLRAMTLSAAVTALVFAALAMPASAGTTLVSGVGVFNNACTPPVGSVPANTGDYPPIAFTGSLTGCLYTYVTGAQVNPSGTYIEQGTETFVGCLGNACGTYEAVYIYTAKYTDESLTQEIHGRCQHSIVGGTGDFADAKGVLNYKDDVVNMVFNYRGQIMLASPGANGAAAYDASQALRSGGPTRIDGC